MKSVKVLVAACVLIALFAGCKTYKPAPGLSLSSTAKVETLEHKGTALGVKDIPPWLSEYIQRNGVRSVESLPAYKDMYVIVGTANGPALQQVETWAKNFDAQQQIGATISTRVASVFKAHENLIPDDPEAHRVYDNALNTLVTATYTGARQESDWWIHQRITERGKDPETRYTSYVLYTIQRRILDDQIRSQIEKLKEDSPELSAAFDAVTAQLLEKGLEWD
jgi:hypothetical protein